MTSISQFVDQNENDTGLFLRKYFPFFANVFYENLHEVPYGGLEIVS